MISTQFIKDLFHLPLTRQAHAIFLEMESICIEVKQSQFLKWLIHGATSGEMNFTHQQRFTKYWLVIKRFLNILNGYGKALVNQNTKCSSGCCSMIELTQGIYILRRKTFELDGYNCVVLNCQREEALTTYFGDALFPSKDGISSTPTELPTSLF